MKGEILRFKLRFWGRRIEADVFEGRSHSGGPLHCGES
jgi:hypothetical protein